jgi:hypothetical protein
MSITRAVEYFGRRWRGEVSPPVLLWRDMLGVGTLLNVMATLAALMVASQGAPLHLAVILHFVPLPYNLFLFAALWRTPRRTAAAAGVGLVWVAAMTLA